MQTVDPSQPFVAFLNSDCTPLDEHWLEYLLASFSEGVAAVFGRQVPRPDCKPLFAKDTEDTFGDGERQKKLGNTAFRWLVQRSGDQFGKVCHSGQISPTLRTSTGHGGQDKKGGRYPMRRTPKSTTRITIPRPSSINVTREKEELRPISSPGRLGRDPSYATPCYHFFVR